MAKNNLDSILAIALNDLAQSRGVPRGNSFFGFSIIKNLLVSNSFMDRLSIHLDQKPDLKYGEVISPRNLCGDEFFYSLTRNEQKVLGPCILRLIGEGRISMAFPEESIIDDYKPRHKKRANYEDDVFNCDLVL